MDSSTKCIRIGTRGSLLARTQTDLIVTALQDLYPNLTLQITILKTSGDIHQYVPFNQVGTKGMFVKEIEQALLSGEIDLGVHSLKDMPSELPEGLQLSCTPEREDPRDALVSACGLPLAMLPLHAVVGTSSLRRKAQIRAFRPDIEVKDLRGNLDTRLRKLTEGDYTAIVLASAGLHRLGLRQKITEYLPVNLCLPAVGQGALALETRTDDLSTISLLAPLHHLETALAVNAERAFLHRLEGGCSVPAGAYAQIVGQEIYITGILANIDGSIVRKAQEKGSIHDSESLGIRLAERLLEMAGGSIPKG